MSSSSPSTVPPSPTPESATVAEPEEAPAPRPIVPGVPSALSPLVRRIVAHNPGPMTGPGTNTYLVGIDEIVVIDPGPDDPEHLDAIAGCGGDRIRWIVCTHTHIDHFPGVAGLKKRTGAEVLAFDARDGLEIDRALVDGEPIEATEFVLRALHTPGHASNHLCYLLEQERMLFSGDHIMNGSTVVIRPPDGDMTAYLDQLERLKALRPRLASIAPGHGHLIENPTAKIDEYLKHRREREAQVLKCVKAGTTKITKIVSELYPDLIEELVPMAEATVWAHLLRLRQLGKVTGRSQGGLWRAK
jgi:glyoxylase-like metal-dependent hydrolase (beta-lactamase superfamily II)